MELKTPVLAIAMATLLVSSCQDVTDPDDSAFDPIFQFVDIQFADDQIGLLVESTSVYRTENGGRSWKYSSGAPTYLKGAGFADLQTAIVVGNNWTVLRTTDAGETWSRPFDKYDFKYSAGFYDVSFVDAQTGWIVGGYHVFKTSDGGDTWTKQWNSGSSHIYAGCFTDSLTGTIVTSNSIVRTVDGGQTWVRQKEDIPENAHEFLLLG